jgi:hypothetical protein
MRTIKALTLCIILLLKINSSLGADIFNTSKGGQSAALGYTGICLNNVWSSMNNQAGLSYLNKITAGIYIENRFLIKSLNTKSLAFALPTSTGTFAVSILQFGETDYNETSIGLAYGMTLSKKFSLGLQLFHYAINQSNELGRAGMFSFQGGFIYRTDEGLKIGFHIFNPKFIVKTQNKPELAEIVKIGIQYQISENLNSYFEILNHSSLGNGINSGLEYLGQKKLAFRIGYSSINQKLTFGLGLKLKNIDINIASSMHDVLGYSPQISMTYEF